MKMNKCLLTVLAVATTTAYAQTSSVTIYGVVDLGVRRSEGLNRSHAPAAGSLTALGSGINSTSRWGLRGTEDMGGGLKVTFNLESGLAADTGQQINATKYFDRASWVAIGGDWGRVAAGRQTTPLADTVAATDPLRARFASFNPNIATTGLSAHGLGIEFGPAGSTAGSYRLDNALKYSGNYGNLSGSLMYAFGEGNTTRPLSSKGAALRYTADALTVSAATQKFRASDARELEAWALGATYRLGSLRLAALFGENRADTNVTLTAETRQRVGSLGFTWAASPSVDLTAAYFRLTRSRTGRPDDGYNRLISFAEYKLSRRSKLFAELDFTRWKGGYQGVGNDSRARGVAVGMSHSF